MELFKMLIDKYRYIYAKYFQWEIIQTNFLFLLMFINKIYRSQIRIIYNYFTIYNIHGYNNKIRYNLNLKYFTILFLYRIIQFFKILINKIDASYDIIEIKYMNNNVIINNIHDDNHSLSHVIKQHLCSRSVKIFDNIKFIKFIIIHHNNTITNCKDIIIPYCFDITHNNIIRNIFEINNINCENNDVIEIIKYENNQLIKQTFMYSEICHLSTNKL